MDSIRNGDSKQSEIYKWSSHKDNTSVKIITIIGYIMMPVAYSESK